MLKECAKSFVKTFFQPKIFKKPLFLAILVGNMAKTKKIFEFFGRNRLRMVQNVFYNKNLDFEKICNHEIFGTAGFSKIGSHRSKK